MFSSQCPKFLSEICPKLDKKRPKIKRPKFFASNVGWRLLCDHFDSSNIYLIVRRS